MYCTIDDIINNSIPENRLAELSDDVNAKVINTFIVNTAIANAQDIVDSYIGTAYKLPLSTIDSLLAILTADLAVCLLHKRRHGKLDETVQLINDNVYAKLELIQNGKLRLVSQESQNINSPNKWSKIPKQFTDELLDNF